MGEVRSSILVDLAGNLQRKAGQYNNSLDRMGKSGSRSINMISRSLSKMSTGLDRLGNRYTALLTGAAGVGSVKMVMGLEDRFTRLGIQANKSAGEINALKKEIYDAAMAPDVKLDPGKITSAIEEIVEKTGDLEFAEKNIRNIGLAISATGANGQSIGGIMAEFQKMGIIDPKQILEAMDILNVQGKEGAFTLQNLAALGPRVVTSYTSMGRGGVQAIREMGAALQVIRQGTGSSEMAATAFEALMRTLGDAQKVGMLKKGGVKIFDAEALKDGKEILRPINEIMVDIIKKTGGKKTIMSKIFDAEAIRAFNSAASEFQRTGSLDSIDKFMSVQGDGTTTVQDSARAASTASAAMQNLYTAWKKFADNKLTEPIQKFADILNNLDPDKLERILKIGTGAAIGMGGLIVGNKVLRAGRGMFNFFRGRKGLGSSGGGLGSMAMSMSKPIPVYVVNSKMSMLPDNYFSGSGGKLGKTGSALKGLLKRGPGGLLGVGRGMAMLKGGITVGSAGLGTTVAAGAAAGAIGYGIGTVINKGIDKTMEKVTGGENKTLGGWLYDAIHGEKKKKDAWQKEYDAMAAKAAEKRSQLSIKIETDGNAKARVQTMKSDDLDMEVDSGLMTVGVM